MYALYTMVSALLFVAAAPFFIWKGRATGKYLRTFQARMGRGVVGSRPSVDSIWVHAVSVGEVLAAKPLVERLKARFPATPVFVSTTTMTGNAIAQKALAGADGLFYAPFDWPRPVRRTLARVRPRLLVLVETEIWPNLIHEARRRGIRIAVVNGRISPRSFTRYRRIRRLLTHVLHEVDLFLMQSEAHAGRILAMGGPPDRVRISGNLKFDALSRAAANVDLTRLIAGGGPLWVAGSTTAGEEEAVVAAFCAVRERHPDVRLLLAPRHPERFGAAAAVVEAAGLRCAKRSTLDAPWTGSDVLLLDTLGELAQVYSLATVAFVGGSLVASGGHNILEAAIHGKAVIVGPHMENFQEIADVFLADRALIQVVSAEDLAEAVAGLLGDEARRLDIGDRARALVDRHRGALDRTVEALAALVA
jgi:3-deoxy-D-manno-octulosonic-acid transferase